MSDPPPSDLVADTNENLQNRLTRQGFGLATERRPPNPAYRLCKWIIIACKDYVNNTLVINVLHASAVGAGFIPVLPATDKIQSKYHAAARMGINPTPTAAECCKLLSISGLHRILGLVVGRK